MLGSSPTCRGSVVRRKEELNLVSYEGFKVLTEEESKALWERNGAKLPEDAFKVILSFISFVDLKTMKNLKDTCRLWRVITNEYCIKDMKLLLVFKGIFNVIPQNFREALECDEGFFEGFFNASELRSANPITLKIFSKEDEMVSHALLAKFWHLNPKKLFYSDRRIESLEDHRIAENVRERKLVDYKDRINIKFLKHAIVHIPKINDSAKIKIRETNVKQGKKDISCQILILVGIIFALSVIVNIIPSILGTSLGAVLNFVVLPKVHFSHNIFKIISTSSSFCLNFLPSFLITVAVSFIISNVLGILAEENEGARKRNIITFEAVLGAFVGSLVSIFPTYFLSFHISNDLTHKIGLRILKFLAVTFFIPLIYGISNTFFSLGNIYLLNCLSLRNYYRRSCSLYVLKQAMKQPIGNIREENRFLGFVLKGIDREEGIHLEVIGEAEEEREMDDL